MLLRLRLDSYDGRHAEFSVFEGREHGPRLGALRSGSEMALTLAEQLGVSIAFRDQPESEHTLRVGDTIEAEITAKAIVRRDGMEVRS